MRALLHTIVVGLILAACTTGGAISKIRPGMSEPEVDSIMGAPDGQSVDGATISKFYTGRFVPFVGPSAGDYVVTLTNGKVTNYGQTALRQQQVNTHVIYHR